MCLAAVLVLWQGSAHSAGVDVGSLANDNCLGCHGNPGFAAQGADGKARQLGLNPGKFAKSVHGKRRCVECHTDVAEIPHKAGVTQKVNCVNCHDALWNAAKAKNRTQENARLAVVVQQIDSYMKSVHARPNRADPSRANASCSDCHAPHTIYPKDSTERAEWRLNVPNACGRCHPIERQQYAASVHGKAVENDKNPTAAICSDCHTTHEVADPAKDTAKLAITKNCGGCHVYSLKTYTGTYHGKVNTLGYANTAKCFDCHGSHDILGVADPQSSMHPANRLTSCRTCHPDATDGFATFEPHGTSNDLLRYPGIWVASKLMLLMVSSAIAFFWSHAALWFYREYKDRQEGKSRPQVKLEGLSEGQFKGKQFQRFPLIWRIAHLTAIMSLMMLTLTGMSVLYSDTGWAPVVIHWLGGPKVEAVIHRTFAVVLAIVFFAQLIYLVVHAVRNRRTFDWFGPDSLAPRLQDLWDIFAMFRWFFGMGPKPVFDRWTYWEKFDYWAPFSAVLFIGICGVMLWVPGLTATVLPGWAFNVVTIFHGEGALLAVLFLFTVHFFNNHFRPDKFPLEVVMFTGSMPIEQFKHEHRVEFNRLVGSGELDKHLVDAPSQPMILGARMLGFTLIACGLLLLVIVLIGVFKSMTGG